MKNSMQDMELGRLMTISEVASLTTISKQHIYTLARQDKFPKSKKIGASKVAWLRSDVNSWINNKLGIAPAPEDIHSGNASVNKSLRDQLASAALTGIISGNQSLSPQKDSIVAYQYADAMMEAREK